MTPQLLCVQCLILALDAGQVIVQPPTDGTPHTAGKKEVRAALMCMSSGQLNATDHMWFDGRQLVFTPITLQDGDALCIDHLT